MLGLQGSYAYATMSATRLDRFLGCAITQEHLDRKSCISLPSKEKEEFLLNRLKFNPL